MKNKILFAVLVSILSACSSLPTNETRTIASVDSLQFVPGTAYATQVQALLKSATSSIDIIQFNFDSSNGFVAGLANNLIQSKQNNKQLQIRVVLEAKGFGAEAKNTATANMLRAAGITVELVTGLPHPRDPNNPMEHGILHSKVVVVDKHLVLAGSTNWTNTSIQRNNETDLLVDSKEFGLALSNYADDLIQNSQHMLTNRIQVGSVSLFLDDAYFPALIDFLNSSGPGDSLACSMYLFNIGDSIDVNSQPRADEILATLESVISNKHVKLSLLLDNDRFQPLAQTESKLVAKKLLPFTKELFLAPINKITHQKYCVLSRANGHFSTILGSSNWNYLDLDLNHQVNWIVDDDAFGRALLAYSQQVMKTDGTLFTSP